MALDKDALEHARKYIAIVRWIFAKTYAKSAPHEYTLRKERPELDADFVSFVILIRSEGYDGKFGDTTLPLSRY